MAEAYYIEISGERIPVSEAVYHAYKRSQWREAKQRRVCIEREYSLDALEDDGYNIASSEASVDDVVVDKLLLACLFEALAELSGEDRRLIGALFYEGKSERDVSAVMGIPFTTLNYRKHKILQRLRKKLK